LNSLSSKKSGDQKYLTSKEAGFFSGYTHDYISRLCRTGKVEGKLVGRSWFVVESSLVSFVDRQKEKKQISKKILSDTRK